MITRALLVVCALAGVASANSWKEKRALLEWSTWVRVGVGVESHQDLVRTRSIGPAPATRAEQRTFVEGALGAELTLLAPTPEVRLGPWLELRTDAELFLGAQLLLAGKPRDLNMFQYSGEGIWSLRVGASATHATAAIAWGYRCPWEMYGGHSNSTRYTIGARIVATATRGRADGSDWSASLGIEFEPVGALRYLLGISDWY